MGGPGRAGRAARAAGPGDDPRIELLLAFVDEGFDRPAWHGPTLWGALRGISAAQADWRPARGRHTIRELTTHAAYWKHVVRRRLTGDARAVFALEGDDWFDASAASRQWVDDRRLLLEEHRKLRATIAAYPASMLNRPVDRKQQSAAFTIRGIAAHDIYHAGQIRVIRALQGRQVR